MRGKATIKGGQKGVNHLSQEGNDILDNRPMGSLRLTLDALTIHPFSLLFQHGVMIKVEVNCSMRTMLCQQLGLSPQYVEDRIKTIFLDGRPVDDIDSAFIRDGSTLALSAAMPGLVGAILRRGGHLAPMRSQIAHREEKKVASRRQGTVVLKLFNLLIDELGPSILERGVIVGREDLKSLLMSLQEKFGAWCKKAQVNGQEIDGGHLLKWLHKYELVFLQIEGDER